MRIEKLKWTVIGASVLIAAGCATFPDEATTWQMVEKMVSEDFTAPFGIAADDRGGGLVAGGFDAEYGQGAGQWTFTIEGLERGHGSNIRARYGANAADQDRHARLEVSARPGS